MNDPYGDHPADTPTPPPPPIYSSASAGAMAFCPGCGTNLAGVAIGGGCPGCGRPVTPASLGAHGSGSSGKAVASMVLGICSFVGCMLYGVPGVVCGILAIVFARQVKSQVDAGRLSPSVLGMSNAGRICGIIGLCLSVLTMLLMIAYFVFIFWFIGQASQNNPPFTPPQQPAPIQPQPAPAPAPAPRPNTPNGQQP